MKIVKSCYEILQCPVYEDALKLVEAATRTCYKSEDKSTERTAEPLIRKCIKRGHHTLLEYVNVIVRFICSRGISHELVRHRHISVAQESTRYVSYENKEIEVIQPYWMSDETVELLYRGEAYLAQKKEHVQAHCWYTAMTRACDSYMALLAADLPPQAARGVLPNDIKTEMVVSVNVRELRHIFKLRSSLAATGAPHPDMVRIMDPFLLEMKSRLPVFFEDV